MCCAKQRRTASQQVSKTGTLPGRHAKLPCACPRPVAVPGPSSCPPHDAQQGALLRHLDIQSSGRHRALRRLLPLRQRGAQPVPLCILGENRLLDHHRLGAHKAGAVREAGPDLCEGRRVVRQQAGQVSSTGRASGGPAEGGVRWDACNRAAPRLPAPTTQACAPGAGTCTGRSRSCQQCCAAVRTSVSKAPSRVSTAGGKTGGSSRGSGSRVPGAYMPQIAFTAAHLLGSRPCTMRRPRRCQSGPPPSPAPHKKGRSDKGGSGARVAQLKGLKMHTMVTSSSVALSQSILTLDRASLL